MAPPGGGATGAIAHTVGTLTRHVAWPLVALGAVFVLLSSFACGRFLESRISARAADRASAISVALAASPAVQLSSFGADVALARLDETGSRVLDASAPSLLGERSPALSPTRNGLDGRYWVQRGHLRADDGRIVHYWTRLDLTAEFRDAAVQQLVVALGGILFVSGIVELVRRRLRRALSQRLSTLCAAVEGHPVASPDGERDEFDRLAEASVLLHAALGESRRRERAAADRATRGAAEFQAWFKQMPVPLLRVRADGRVMDANHAALRLCAGDLALPGPLSNLLDAALPQALAARGEGLLRGGAGEVPVAVRGMPVQSSHAGEGDEYVEEWVLVLDDQRARAESALRASEERYRRMFETCNEGIWVLDTNLCTVSANARLGQMLGLDPATLQGRPVSQFIAEEREILVAELHAALAGGSVPPREVALSGGDDLRVWAMLSATALPGPERGALVLMLADITSTKSAEEALRASEQRLAMAAANGSITMWEYDCASGALVIDPRFTATLDSHATSTVHDLASLLATCHPDDVGSVRRALADHVAGRTPHYEPEFRLADAHGEWRWLRAQGQAERDADGHARRVLGIQRDVTTEKQALAALAHARDEAVRATQAKSRFLASMSHELRTPLNGVLGMLSLLERERLSADQREFVDVAVKSGRTLFELIDDVLDFSKIEAGAVTLSHTACDLRDIAEDVIDMLAERAHQRGIDIVLSWDERVPRRVQADPARLRQVLLNLLGNGVKFTEQGHVALQLRPANDSNAIRFEVTDTGIGIPGDRQLAIFEPFEQADDATARRFGGTGLGLSITRQLVELMGGRLALDSAPGAGSRFSFELPLDALPSEGRGPLALAGRRFLLQEPSTVVAAGAAALLRAHGASVEVVHDAREVGQTLAARQVPPDALILAAPGDLQRFGQDIASLRDAHGASLLPVIGLLPFGRRAAADELRALGAQGVITKPVRERHVLRVLDEVFSPDALESPAATTPRLRASSADDGAGGLAALKVLVVDDVTTNLKVAAGMLGRLGIQATLADSGRAALDAISTTAFDVVFMDCQMPGMDGFETTALIRARHLPGEGPHIIAMTANAASTDRERCLAHGMDDYLAKPVLLSDLERVLHRWSKLPGVAPPLPAARPSVPDVDGPAERRTLDELSSLLGPAEFDALCVRFRRDARQLLDRLAAALSGADLDAARRAAHALKGAAANLGASRLAALCRKAETQDVEALRSSLGALESALEEFCGLMEEGVTAA